MVSLLRINALPAYVPPDRARDILGRAVYDTARPSRAGRDAAAPDSRLRYVLSPGRVVPVGDSFGVSPLVLVGEPCVLVALGNPHSRTHKYGWDAEAAIEAAREQVASLCGADAKEIIFTSVSSPDPCGMNTGVACCRTMAACACTTSGFHCRCLIRVSDTRPCVCRGRPSRTTPRLKGSRASTRSGARAVALSACIPQPFEMIGARRGACVQHCTELLGRVGPHWLAGARRTSSRRRRSTSACWTRAAYCRWRASKSLTCR